MEPMTRIQPQNYTFKWDEKSIKNKKNRQRTTVIGHRTSNIEKYLSPKHGRWFQFRYASNGKQGTGDGNHRSDDKESEFYPWRERE
ncbi:MAG: hypothetical protein RLZZ30_934 [Bacteroidota bacterium]